MRTDGHVRNLARNRRFRHLLAVRLTSQAADGMFQASLALSVFFNPALGEAGDPFRYATAVALLLGPYSLLGPYVGTVLDRFSRRNLIGGANLVRAALMIVICLTLPGGFNWTWVLCAMVVLAANRFVLAGLSATHPQVVPERDLVTANSLASTLGALAYGLGLATTGVAKLLDSNISYSMLALAAGCGYLVSAFIVWASFKRDSLGPAEDEAAPGGLWQGIAATTAGMIAGFKHLGRRRGPALVMAVQGLHRFLYGIVFIIAIALFMGFFWDVESDPTHRTTISWLLVLAVLGNVGVLAAAIVTPRATRVWGPKNWVVVLMALCAVVVAALAGTMRPVMFAVAVLLVNIASQGVKITVDTSIQRGVEDAYRGRVFSVNDTIYNVGYLAGLFAAALVVPTDGYAPGTLVGVAVSYGLICVGYAYLARDDAPYDAESWSPAAPHPGPQPRPSTSR
ncbi:MFS transporter [Glycomyces albidus]|jgi:predicted MFS family arabinose efflux permease|uniref:MFS transporter n=1 Tax=Glycomyces albidus TaxID=2656774 RepID=A0A6L5GBX1_9ACTN|nr:MFS transporter [Glycomyces albidus]MQM27164.1 MFS transporter [Glycomyces albidus]